MQSVDFIICENPIHSLKLLNKLDIKKKLFSLHDYNEDFLIKKIEKYQLNSSIALISDAGSPLISDPGYNLVNDYIKKNIYITTIPGPTSLISSLQLSGMPINNFQFCGFISKNKSAMNNQAKNIENSNITSVFLISGTRLLSFLEILINNNISREIAVCKEITKINEFVFRGKTNKVMDDLNKNHKNFKGEFVLLIKGKEKNKKIQINDVVIENIEKLLKKFSLTEVVELVHRLTNISKKKIYSEALKIKK